MGNKRKRTGYAKQQGGWPKRQQHGYDNEDENSFGFQGAKGYIDPSTGQRGAFPGLEEYGDDFFCGPANDGIDYLRMVRSEARGVPSLLVAKALPVSAVFECGGSDEELEGGDEEVNQEEYGEDGTRGWYEDGSYIATATACYPQRPSSPNKVAILAWHEFVLEQFRKMRNVLHGNPPLSVSTTGTLASNVVSSTRPLPHKQEDWLDLLYKTSPTVTYLWKMDQHTVLKGMKIMVDLLKVGADTPVEQTRWIYGLLLRCSEVMTPDEVFIVRELGKRALHVQKRLEFSNCLSGTRAQVATPESDHLKAITTEGEEADRNHSAEASPPPNISEGTSCDLLPAADTDSGAFETPSGELETPSDDISPVAQSSITPSIYKKRKNRKAKSGVYDYVPSANTLGTLDVIISIVGDFFGQRDLLDDRKYHTLGGTWNEM